MTETSRPWNGVVMGDAGPYSDAQWQTLYKAIIGFGAGRADNGVFLMSGTTPNDGLKVQAQAGPTSSVDVLLGAALVQGIAYLSSATVAFTPAANASGNPRIDTIILRADYALQTVRLALLQGTPAASPVAATLTQSAGIMWEIPLADILLASGFTTIAQSLISPRRFFVNAPPAIYLDAVLNNSGATLNEGQVVIWDTTADRAVTTTTVRDSKRVAGVWVGQTANGSSGRVLRLGIGYVKADAAITRGDLLTTGTTAGSATKPGTNEAALNGVIGRALETTSGAGLVLTMVNAHSINDMDYVVVQDQKTSGTTAGNVTAGSYQTRTLNTKVVDTGSIASLVSTTGVSLPRGRYSVVGFAGSGANLGAHRCRLRDVTNNVTLVLGMSAFNNANTMLNGEFDLTGTATVELQHWVTSTASGGQAVSTGENEVYSSLTFIRQGESS